MCMSVWAERRSFAGGCGRARAKARKARALSMTKDGFGQRTASRSSPRCRLAPRSEEHTSELQSQSNLVCRLLLEKKKKHHTSLGLDNEPRHLRTLSEQVLPTIHCTVNASSTRRHLYTPRLESAGVQLAHTLVSHR